MGTRGIYGLRKNKKDKMTYNHYDSYPEGLGNTILDYIKQHTNKEMNILYDRLELVDQSLKFDELSDEQQKNISDMYFKENNNQQKDLSKYDMYSLLHSFQGELNKYDDYDKINFMTDDASFIKDSLFCEWGYIINLDKNVLEVWEGFQKKPQKNNRYGTKDNNGYYPCKKIKEFKFKDIRKDVVQDLSLLIDCTC